MLELGDPLGWDITYDHNYLKQQEYFAELTMQRHNRKEEYQFVDVYEHLVLIMIIRREIINFALEKGHRELLQDPDKFFKQNYERTNGDDDDYDDQPPDTDTDRGDGPPDALAEKKRDEENKIRVSIGGFSEQASDSQKASKGVIAREETLKIDLKPI